MELEEKKQFEVVINLLKNLYDEKVLNDIILIGS
jgi:hypothetical protein